MAKLKARIELELDEVLMLRLAFSKGSKPYAKRAMILEKLDRAIERAGYRRIKRISVSGGRYARHVTAE